MLASLSPCFESGPFAKTQDPFCLRQLWLIDAAVAGPVPRLRRMERARVDTGSGPRGAPAVRSGCARRRFAVSHFARSRAAHLDRARRA